jgi:hypothetical protein
MRVDTTEDESLCAPLYPAQNAVSFRGSMNRTYLVDISGITSPDRGSVMVGWKGIRRLKTEEEAHGRQQPSALSPILTPCLAIDLQTRWSIAHRVLRIL